jgi:SAM-dependent methyltransferase
MIDYRHKLNRHGAQGPLVALPILLDGIRADSLLDVGCGTGTWLRAALDMGVERVRGIDGVALPASDLHVDPALIHVRDLSQDWKAEQRYDVALCLEVAEHLDESAAQPLIRKLTEHSDRVVFSAAPPWQGGQHHVNRQWPPYWQDLFNRHGFACYDRLRWKIWERREIEPWYRQNVFLAEKNEKEAGSEPRIPSVVHPDIMRSACEYWRRSRQSLPEVLAERLNRAVRRILGRQPHE